MYIDSNLCDDCSGLFEMVKLINYLIKDIQHLESEIIRTRYELSQYLSCPYDEYLRSDILSNLAGRYAGNEAYQTYVKMLYNNQDPMESKEWVDYIWKLAHGHEDSKY